MQVKNVGKDLILGAVHNGRFVEGPISIKSGEIIDLTEQYLGSFDPADIKGLVPPSTVKAKTTTVKAAAAAKTIAEVELAKAEAEMAALLAESQEPKEE